MKLVFARPMLCWGIFLAFFISLKLISFYKILNVGIPLKKVLKIYLKEQCQALMLCAKRSVIEFRIVSSIYLQNFKVGQQLEQELLANFKWQFKMETVFYTHCMWHFCAVAAFWKCHLSGWWSRYMRLCACAEHLDWDFSAHYLLLLRWGECSYRRDLFSSLRLCLDSGLFVVSF